MAFRYPKSLVVVFALGACGGEEQVDYNLQGVELGALQTTGEFQPFSHGDLCEVVDATQGGYWVMPSLVAWGLDPDGDSAQVDCELFELETEHVLGQMSGERRFYGQDDGTVSTNLLLRLPEVVPQSLVFFDGRHVALSCEVTGASGVAFTSRVDLYLDVPTELSLFANQAEHARKD